MGLISTRKYDRAMRFFSDVARKIRTSPPIQAVRRIHSQSFQEVQQVQSEIERYYRIQYRPSQSRSTSQSSRYNQASLPPGKPQPLPPANHQPLGQLPPYRPTGSRSSQQPAPRTQQPPRSPERPEWQQRRPERQNRWGR